MSRKSQDAKKSRELYNESQELESLQRVFARLDKNGDRKVDSDELYDCVRYLGYKCSKKEVQDMVWEVHSLPLPRARCYER
jgi:Ca2+-binding EF-hand superfamily protein